MRLLNYITATITFAASVLAPSAEAYTEFNRYGTDPSTSDLALIYAGGEQRPQWTVDEIMPYVIHTYSDGHKDWFFDSFLVLEFANSPKDLGFQNGVGRNYATKADWEWLLDRQLDGAVTSIEQAVSIGKSTLGEPRMRHKIVMAMPAPIKAQGKNWGELNGKVLDFDTEEDRFQACKWFVTELIKRFKNKNFKNIDLTGIYWLEEGLYTNDNVVPRVNDWIYRNCLRSYWIPYYANNEQFKFNWHDKYKFDVAYQQPNYFFERSTPMSQLEAACDESKRYGLGLEMEFETQGTSRLQHDDPDSYYDRLVDYINVFKKKGVFEEAAMAWYSGTKGFLDLARSKDAKNHEIADTMASIVARRQAAKAASMQYPTNAVRDLALIWQGALRRIDWTPEQFEPYVAHTFADGHKDWLFDGYLFLEGDIDGKIRFIPWAGFEGANKGHWEWYLDRLFEKGKSLDALDKCIGKLKQEIGDPGFRHKIVLSQLIPVPGNKHWGQLNGKDLDFDVVEDQLAACHWFINQLIDRFNAAGYENLDLHGIYWLDEDFVHNKNLPKQLSPFIHEKGLEFSWIPYFKARGYERWQDEGFDIAYMQAGHAFSSPTEPIPSKRLEEACDVARSYGMSMEFECDHNSMSQVPNSLQHNMWNYIDAFERNGVWENGAVAYYTGSKAFISMAENPSPGNRAVMDYLANIIVKRRSNPKLAPASCCKKGCKKTEK